MPTDSIEGRQATVELKAEAPCPCTKRRLKKAIPAHIDNSSRFPVSAFLRLKSFSEASVDMAEEY